MNIKLSFGTIIVVWLITKEELQRSKAAETGGRGRFVNGREAGVFLMKVQVTGIHPV